MKVRYFESRRIKQRQKERENKENNKQNTKTHQKEKQRKQAENKERNTQKGTKEKKKKKKRKTKEHRIEKERDKTVIVQQPVGLKHILIASSNSRGAPISSAKRALNWMCHSAST
jgi:hypothetical protein